ncbi:MAG TPA: acetyl/propionyl/methylcrotonyl-CoA carboxylase subunit alpha [Aestuariivirgaceae bacterium]
MFRKILIANRGEIACRIIKTARRLGISTVAVYSSADARALHVEMADEAVHIGPAPAVQSYLRIERIIEACKRTRAEALHPGYGFLSERADFAHALKTEGIVFIGPNAEAIRAMGDKIESKKCASSAGISIVPGHIGIVETAEQAVEIARSIGFPVMIKASAGGGGKGMRIARSPQETREGFDRARAEAASSFGDDRLFIERYILNPRHIEIQVLGDKHGNIIHLGERECSIQRRNQKVIEECPSPLLDEATRRAMGEQAVRLAKAVNYDSAGTVEFVAGQNRSFYFLEMNTRLQVEHPVTELVTGIDLVEQMIRVAAGEPLQLRQPDVTLSGWAIESRIYAEDPYREFMPSTGRLRRFQPPTEAHFGASLRIDTGVYEGGEISVYYDPMIAKLVTHAPDRAKAIEAMASALDAFRIEGIRHNIPFLAAIMANENWRKGCLSNGFINEEFPGGFRGIDPEPQLKSKIMAVAAAVSFAERSRRRRISGQLRGRPAEPPRRLAVKFEEEWHELELAPGSDGLWISHQGARTKFHIEGSWAPSRQIWRGFVNNEPVLMQLRPLAIGYEISHRGVTATVQIYSERAGQLARLMPPRIAKGIAREVRCPMPGLVISIHVVSGQEVKAGDTLAIVEAMKMQNILRAERDGKVKALRVSPGDTLAVDAVIMDFE